MRFSDFSQFPGFSRSFGCFFGKILAFCAVLALAGCESSEERAERHFRSGLALLETGEISQALIEFRNVFEFDTRHREARATYARVQRDRGELADAYSQYLRLVEQYPDTLEARVALTELALEGRNWDEAEVHGRAARALAPSDPQVALLNAVLDYRAAVLNKDTAATAAPLAIARARLAADPADMTARRLTIDAAIATGDKAAALAEVEAGLAAHPELYEYHGTRLQLLAEAGETEAVGAALEDMAERFPEDAEVRRLLIAWYLERQDLAGAEALLRRVAEAPGASTEARLTVVEFLRLTRGAEAAMAELDQLIAQGAQADGPSATGAAAADAAAGAEAGSGAGPGAGADAGADVFRAMRATLDYEAGRTAEAIAAMKAMLSARGAGETVTADNTATGEAATGEAATDGAAPAAAPGPVAGGTGSEGAGSGAAVSGADAPGREETHNFRIMLARMLLGTEDAAGARAQIDTVLAGDPSQVEALKMRAAWLIDEDKPSDAILALRAALAEAPRDPGILVLMGQAHEREGARGLAGERYALAVEVSNRAAPESLRYAGFLLADDRVDVAENVLTEALGAAPQNLDLLQAMADLQMRRQDWDRATDAVAKVRALGTPEAEATANGLSAQLLMRQERLDETITFLEGLVTDGDGATAALAALVQAQVEGGQVEAARRLLDERLAQTPDSPPLQFLRAGVHVIEEEFEPAEALYRALVTEYPESDRPLRVLYGLLISQDRAADATALVDQALAAAPQIAPVRMLKAEDLERQGDFDGAIAIYDVLYAENSANLLVANNLASLIATHREDPESLERAFAIARRLQGQDVPAFQDTTGWIEYRRGNFAEALADLEPAAAGLPGDPLVQFHLGMTYAAMERPAEARTALERALAIAGDRPLPQFARARGVLAGLPVE